MKKYFFIPLCCTFTTIVYPVKFQRQLHDDKTDEAAKLCMAWNNTDIFILEAQHI